MMWWCPVCENDVDEWDLGFYVKAGGKRGGHLWKDGNGLPTACGPVVKREPVDR